MTQLIEIRACGIPAMARVTYAHYTKPNPNTWDSDFDYYGGWTLGWELCDRRGRPAPWLERKLNKRETDRIEGQIIEALEEK